MISIFQQWWHHLFRGAVGRKAERMTGPDLIIVYTDKRVVWQLVFFSLFVFCLFVYVRFRYYKDFFSTRIAFADYYRDVSTSLFFIWITSYDKPSFEALSC